MYCNDCNEYVKLKKSKTPYIFKKILSLSIVYSVVTNIKNIHKR